MQITVIEHPLIKHKITKMREVETTSKDFREYLNEIAMLITYEVTRALETEKIAVTTPVGETIGYKLKKEMTVVPILRAGLGLLTGVLQMIPNARVGHIGLYRDEKTLQPVEYYCKLPPDKEAVTIVLDPMLATGGSAVAAIELLKKRGIHDIRFMCLVAAPEGVETLNAAHPDVMIYTAALDECLNEHGYIVPGLGDAGDRIFGTL